MKNENTKISHVFIKASEVAAIASVDRPGSEPSHEAIVYMKGGHKFHVFAGHGYLEEQEEFAETLSNEFEEKYDSDFRLLLTVKPA